MKSNNFFRLFFCIVAGIFLVSCDFPYQPKRFVLPAIPSPFIATDSIAVFIGTSNVKIAYTLNEGSRWVYFIDFNKPSPMPVKLKKPAGKENINGDSPLISPDGSFVTYYLTHGADIQGAYLQKLDSSASPVLVAANGTEPHWWKDSSGQVYIVYSDQMMSTSLVKGNYFTYRQKVSLEGIGSLIGPAETIAAYPMNGGMSAKGRFLCTGYMNAAFYAIADSALIPINEGIQTCNPSIDPDSADPGSMMFLNIGGPQHLNNPFSGNADFPGTVLPPHSVLFIVNTENTVLDYVPLSLATSKYLPYLEWQDPEWSNNPGFASALGVIDEANADIMIIKNIDDRMLAKELLNVTPDKYKVNSTSTPYLWIGR
jgi:hypothetical protein